jgi:uncharacterized protein
MARKSLIMQLALATLVGMPLIALAIDHFSEDTVDLRTSLIGFAPLWKQVIFGAAAGIIIAVIAQFIIASPLLREVNVQYANLLGRFHLSWSEILFISVCAGVGEEVLFRGAIQPFFGIIITAFVFVGIHGYISPNNWRLSIYGLYMTVAMCLAGYLAKVYGLLSAIILHTLIDVYLLHFLQKTAARIPVTENHNLPEDFEEEKDDDF